MKPDDLLAQCEGFDWDNGNIIKNWLKHKIAANECEQLFFNQPLVIADDEKHSSGEQRYYLLGQTDSGRRLFAVLAIRGKRIRIISARDMSRKERKVYATL